MVDNGGGVKETYPLNNPPHSPPKISTNPGLAPIYVNQNSHTEASSNPNKGTITYTNGSYHEVIAERDPLLQAMNDIYNQYKNSNAAVSKAFQSKDKQALDEAVVTMKKAFLDAEVNGNEAAKKAAAKMATELRGMGATIGHDVTLEQAKTKVIESKYNSMATSNSIISNGLAHGTRLSLNEAVTETKRLFAEAEKSNDEVSKTAAHMLANHLRSLGATMPADVSYEQAAANIHLQKLYSPSTTSPSTSSNWGKIISAGLDMVPVLSELKGVTEGLTGRDMVTNEELSGIERGFALSIFIPGRGWIRAADKVGDVLDAVNDARKGGKALENGVNLTDAQRATLNSLENTIRDHLKEKDFSGAARDLAGNPVILPSGRVYDHLNEMKDSQRSLKKVKNSLEGSLKNPNLEANTRQVLEEALEKTNRYLERIEETLNGGK